MIRMIGHCNLHHSIFASSTKTFLHSRSSGLGSCPTNNTTLAGYCSWLPSRGGWGGSLTLPTSNLSWTMR
jgi:hypothetical protein